MATNSQVDAATLNAGAFFADSRLVVPDYQRKYSWIPDEQIAEFWRDLSRAIGRGDYFLGLVILAEGKERDEVVDGQQRLVTLTILANELRLIALNLGRKLVAESIRTDFLDSMNFETEEQIPRIHLTDEADRADLRTLLNATDAGTISVRPRSAIHAARAELASRLNADIGGHAQPALRVGQWTEFLTKNLTFAVFTHPDRNAAFRVYEVVNTRGKDLTPTELIKSHLIGSSGDRARDETYRRWNAIENQLETVGAVDQLTTFVRHVVTLERGYVIPRDLYDEVSTSYTGAEGVQRLLEILERFLPTYLQMIEPAADVESTEVRTRAFAIADELGAARFRPTLLAASASYASDELLPRILQILIPGLITGRFGSGNVEAQFARSARRAHKNGDWDAEIARLNDLKPTREEFELRLTRGVSRTQAHVLLSALLQSTPLPELVGYPHQLRPRNGEHWPGFDADQYKEAGGLIANWVLTTVERRPQGSRTPGAVKAKLMESLIDLDPRSAEDVDSWNADRVKCDSESFASKATELWYGTE